MVDGIDYAIIYSREWKDSMGRTHAEQWPPPRVVAAELTRITVCHDIVHVLHESAAIQWYNGGTTTCRCSNSSIFPPSFFFQ